MIMEQASAFTVENFISVWNNDFPNYPLAAGDLNEPHKVLGAFFFVFDRLGINKEVGLLQAPTDDVNKHLMYYWDLFPVINTTRIVNHLLSIGPHAGFTTNINNFLQPLATTSYSILIILFNINLFNEQVLKDIVPYEQELFSKSDEVKYLETRINRLLQMLNEQAAEKGQRVVTLEKLDIDIKQFDEELKQEKEGYDKEKQELDVLLNENKQAEILLKQKKAQRDGLIAEVEKKTVQRVYDADDIKAQAKEAAQNVQEAEETLNTLRATLMQKENSLKNLQAIKPNLDLAYNLSHEIMKLSESMKDDDPDFLELDTEDGELMVLDTELKELETLLEELRTSRAERADNRKENQARRLQERMLKKMKLVEAEDKEKKNQERAKTVTQCIQEIKQLTVKYEDQKTKGMAEVARIEDTFITELKSFEDALMKKTLEAKEKIEEKIRNRRD